MTLFPVHYTLRGYQEAAVSAAVDFLKGPATHNAIEVLPTGCHAMGTKILMADGTIRLVEDIRVGERVMGSDGSPREVLNLCRGWEMMYRITPRRGGESFVVNENHVLSLVSTSEGKKAVCPSHQKGGERTFITVGQWLKKAKSWRHLRKLHRSEELPLSGDKDIILPPWIFGVILGGGCTLNGVVNITTPDQEIIEEVKQFAESWGCSVRQSKKEHNKAVGLHLVKKEDRRNRTVHNPILDAVRSLGLAEKGAAEKYIPHNYKVASATTRLELLAGLLDTDGYNDKNCGYDFISKSPRLASDVAFIARSLGLTVSESLEYKECQTGEGGYYSRLHISGDTKKIPCRVQRKKANPRRQKKNNLVTGFTVEPVGEGDFFGFELDGDHLYLTADFFVHHNSGKSLIIANIVARLDAPCLIFQPSKEILEQNLSKLESYGYRGSVYSASKGRTEVSNITFATIGSVVGKSHLFERFPYIIIDECHKICATEGMYKTFLDAVNGAKVLGLTATPYRLASNSYGSELRFLTRTRPRIFRELIYYVQNRALFDAGYLARLQYRTADGFDRGRLSLNSTGADFTDDSVQSYYRKINFPDQIVRTIEREMETRRNALVFTRFVEEARYVVSWVPGSAIVTGETPKKERERLIEGFKRGDIPVICNVGVLCLDEKTEILTDTGWTGIDDMTYKHKVASWKKDGTIEFSCPSNIVRRPREPGENMVSVKGRAKDFRVTSNHRMVIAMGRDRYWTDTNACQIAGRICTMPVNGIAHPFQCEIDSTMVSCERKHRRKIALAHSLRKRGSSYEESNLEAEATVEKLASIKAKSPDELSINECFFIGFWLGDGSLASGRCTLAQSMAYPAIIRWVDDLLEAIGFSYSRSEKTSGVTKHVSWTVARGTGSREQARAKGFVSVEPYLDKKGSPYLWGLDKDQFAALLHGFWLADGNHGDGTGSTYQRGKEISGAQKELYDLLQAIGVCRGYKISIAPESKPKKDHWSQQYSFRWTENNSHNFLRERAVVETIWKPERVWCVTSSTGYIITRRNGKVLVTGNSTGFDYPELETVIIARPTMSLGLYYQMAGRGFRLHPDKEYARIIDLCGNYKMFGKIEDLEIVDGGNGKWHIQSNGRQLTNTYYGERRTA